MLVAVLVQHVDHRLERAVEQLLVRHPLERTGFDFAQAAGDVAGVGILLAAHVAGIGGGQGDQQNQEVALRHGRANRRGKGSARQPIAGRSARLQPQIARPSWPEWPASARRESAYQ